MIRLLLLLIFAFMPLICESAPGSYDGSAYLEDDGGYTGGSIPYFQELYFAYLAILVLLKLNKSGYVDDMNWLWVPIAPAIAAAFSFWLIGLTVILGPIYLVYKWFNRE